MANSNAKSSARTASGLNLLAGAWLIIAPWALGYSQVSAAVWNDVIVGATIVILAGIRTATPDRYTGVSWTNVVLGVWLLVAPFILVYSAGGAPVWNDIIVGILVVSLGWVSAANTAKLTTAR
jgi:predicted signal transduction protein with EAL and GGDEF domain